MQIVFSPRAWYEYTGWQLEDKKTLKRINTLIKDIERICVAIGRICAIDGESPSRRP